MSSLPHSSNIQIGFFPVECLIKRSCFGVSIAVDLYVGSFKSALFCFVPDKLIICDIMGDGIQICVSIVQQEFNDCKAISLPTFYVVGKNNISEDSDIPSYFSNIRPIRTRTKYHLHLNIVIL